MAKWWFCVLVAASLGVTWSGGSFGSDRPRPPNLLLLLSDDHSYPFVGCYGDSNVSTPNLDRLADRGFRSHRFFTSAPQCVPSRAALMTGKSPVAARITRFSSPLSRNEITFPELLRRDAGYYTGICGRSFHLDGSAGKNNPIADRVFTENNMRTFRDRVDFLENGPDRTVPSLVAKFLDSRPSEKPFFLWANFSDPHHVWDAEEKFRPQPESLKLPPHWPDLPGVREQVADYCAEVNRLDQTVGNVIAELEKRELLDSTIILFLGDNGAALPHGKGSLYDPGSHVPCIAAGPGIPAKQESKALLSGEDVAPTFLEAAGISQSVGMTGKSFWSLLHDREYAPREFIFVERGPHGSAPVASDMTSSGYDLARSVRSDRYKLIYNCTPWIPYSPVDSAGGAAWREIKLEHESQKLSAGLEATFFSSPRPVYELYDLEKDPSELSNVIGQPDLAAVEDRLREAMIEKMILDFDYLPLPEPFASKSKKKQGDNESVSVEKQRAATFTKLDANRDGLLSWDEFRADRKPEEAKRWFDLRDVNGDSVIDRREFIPANPLAKP